VSSAAFNPLTFVETQIDMGLEGAHQAALSPDEAYVYVASTRYGTVSVFARDAMTGELAFVQAVRDGEGGIDSLRAACSVAVSPDGGHVYVASWQGDALTAFSRQADSGELTYLEAYQDGSGGIDSLDGAHSVAVSPDNKHVYVASLVDDAVTVFDRDRTTGELSLGPVYRDGVGGVDGLDRALGLALSPDGSHLYATGADDDAVAVFERDATTGDLTFLDVYKNSYIEVDGLDDPIGITVSPDGENVYVTATADGTVVVFGRNPDSGLLTYVEAEWDGVDGVDGLRNAYAVVASADGGHVYVSGRNDDTVVIFGRSAADGALSYVGMVEDGVGGIEDMQSTNSLVLTSDDAQLYVPATAGDSLAAFDRDPGSGALNLIDVYHSADGLEGAIGLVADSLGCLYVAGNDDDALAFFTRDEITGELFNDDRQVNDVLVSGLDGARSVAVTSDGAYVYVAGHDANAVVAFSSEDGCRVWSYSHVATYTDGVDGFDGLNGVQALALSPDDAYLYVASHGEDAVAILSRDPTSGELSYVGMVQDDVGAVLGIGGAYALALSPDGANLYVTGYDDDALVMFLRNTSTGVLFFMQDLVDGEGGMDGLNGANSVAVSPDGRHVYVASRHDDAVAIFSRNVSNGILTYVSRVRDGLYGVDGLNGARAIAIHPDGSQVYVASQYDDALAVFARDATTGALTYVTAHKDGIGGVNGLDTASGVAVSPTGSHVYVSGYGSDAVAVFRQPLAIYLPEVRKDN
jgi:6-phosphogluconolactonase (cycloisomerase 2 family)